MAAPDVPDGADVSDVCGATIAVVTADDFPVLLPLARAYCEFYEAAPRDRDLIALFAALVAQPGHEGLQLLARSRTREPIGFATLLWTWSTTRAGRVGVMEDLFVVPEARSGGTGQALIAACAEECRRRGVGLLTWQTAPGNLRAQRVYDRIGATRSHWVDYSLPVGPPPEPEAATDAGDGVRGERHW